MFDFLQANLNVLYVNSHLSFRASPILMKQFLFVSYKTKYYTHVQKYNYIPRA